MRIARSLLAAAAVLSLGISAYAQDQQSWVVNIPFAFTAGHISMDAGRYSVQQHGLFVVVLAKDGKAAAVATVPDQRTTPSRNTSLVFHRNGDTYSLAQVNTMGSNVEFDAISSKRAPKRLEAFTAPQTTEVMAIGTR